MRGPWQAALAGLVATLGTLVAAVPAFAGAPATTNAATGITSTQAVLHGSDNCGAGGASSFDYGLTAAYGTNVVVHAGTIGDPSPSNNVDQTQLISGLTPGTLYHFRFNDTHCSGPGADLTFTTTGGGGGGGSADLALTATGNSGTVDLGSTLTLTLSETNAVGIQATGAFVSVPLPAGLGFVSATASKGSCTGTTTVVCTFGTLNVAEVATATVVMKANVAGTVFFDSTVGSTTTDPTSSNNTVRAFYTVRSPENARTITLATAPARVAGPDANGANDTVVNIKGTLASTDASCVANNNITIFQSATPNDPSPRQTGSFAAGADGSFNATVLDQAGQYWKLVAPAYDNGTRCGEASATFTIPVLNVTRKLVVATTTRVNGSIDTVEIVGKLQTTNVYWCGAIQTIQVAGATVLGGGAKTDSTGNFDFKVTSAQGDITLSIAENVNGTKDCGKDSGVVTPPARAVPRTLTATASRPDTAKAPLVVTAAIDAAVRPDCTKGVVVTLEQRDGPSDSWAKVDTATSTTDKSARGAATLQSADDAGEFRVSIAAGKVGLYQCGADTAAVAVPARIVKQTVTAKSVRTGAHLGVIHISGVVADSGAATSQVAECVPDWALVEHQDVVGIGTLRWRIVHPNNPNVADGATVRIGSHVYTFRSSAPATAPDPEHTDVLIGVTPGDSLANLVAAIDGGAGAGRLYSALTAVNDVASADLGQVSRVAGVVTLTSLPWIPAAEAVKVATTATSDELVFGAATLTGSAPDWKFVGLARILDGKGNFAGDFNDPTGGGDWRITVADQKAGRFACSGATAPVTVAPQPDARDLTFATLPAALNQTLVAGTVTADNALCAGGFDVTITGLYGGDVTAATGAASYLNLQRQKASFSATGYADAKALGAWRAKLPEKVVNGLDCLGTVYDVRQFGAPAIDNLARTVTVTGSLAAVSPVCDGSVDVRMDALDANGAWQTVGTGQTAPGGAFTLKGIDPGNAYGANQWRLATDAYEYKGGTCAPSARSFTMSFPRPLPPPPPPPPANVTLAYTTTQHGTNALVTFTASTSPSDALDTCIVGKKLDVQVWSGNPYLPPDLDQTIAFGKDGTASLLVPLHRNGQGMRFSLTGELAGWGARASKCVQATVGEDLFNGTGGIPGYGAPMDVKASLGPITVTTGGFEGVDGGHLVTVSGTVEGTVPCTEYPLVSIYSNNQGSLEYYNPISQVRGDANGAFSISFPDPGNAYGKPAWRVVAEDFSTLTSHCPSTRKDVVASPPAKAPTTHLKLTATTPKVNGPYGSEVRFTVSVALDGPAGPGSNVCLQNLKGVATTGGFTDSILSYNPSSKTAAQNNTPQATITSTFGKKATFTFGAPKSLTSQTVAFWQNSADFLVIRGELDEDYTVTVTPTVAPPYYCAPIPPLTVTVPGIIAYGGDGLYKRWSELQKGQIFPDDVFYYQDLGSFTTSGSTAEPFPG